MNVNIETVIIASRNPVKVKAVEAGFKKLFPDKHFHFEGVSVDSGVSEQPMSDQETKEGAINRTLNANSKFDKADFWVGIEGGVSLSDHGMESFAWVYILSKNQKGIAKTASFYLPPKVAKLVVSGEELGPVNDKVFKEHNSKQKNGAVGLLTNNILDRTSYYIEAVILALIPFFNENLYPKNSN